VVALLLQMKKVEELAAQAGLQVGQEATQKDADAKHPSRKDRPTGSIHFGDVDFTVEDEGTCTLKLGNEMSVCRRS